MSSYSIRKGDRRLYNYIGSHHSIYVINFEDMIPGHPYPAIHFKLAWVIEDIPWYWFNKNI